METPRQDLQFLSVHSELVSVRLETTCHAVSNLRSASISQKLREKGKWKTNQVRIEGKVASLDILRAEGKEKGEEDQRGPHDHPELTLIL